MNLKNVNVKSSWRMVLGLLPGRPMSEGLVGPDGEFISCNRHNHGLKAKSIVANSPQLSEAFSRSKDNELTFLIEKEGWIRVATDQYTVSYNANYGIEAAENFETSKNALIYFLSSIPKDAMVTIHGGLHTQGWMNQSTVTAENWLEEFA